MRKFGTLIVYGKPQNNKAKEIQMARVDIQAIQPEAYKAMFGLEAYIAKSSS